MSKYSNSLFKVYDFLKAIDPQAYLPDPSRFAVSTALEKLSASNLSFVELFDSASVTANLVSQPSLSRAWQEQVDSVARFTTESSRIYEKALQSHVAQVSKLSVLAQASLNRIAWEQIGDSLQTTRSLREAIQASVLNFSESYSALYRSLTEQPAILVSLPPFVSRLPTVEFFTEARQIETITAEVEEDAGFGQQRNRTQQEIQLETSDRLVLLLSDLDEGLIALLEGARYASDSHHPDRVRHCATSLRELFTHILHTLAPDEDVRGWSADPSHYHNKRPTRRARLLYICRTINHGPLAEFIQADTAAMLELLGLFQRGTHEVVVAYTSDQLTAMEIRMESYLRFLLEIHRAE
jgi:hypothetical protein